MKQYRSDIPANVTEVEIQAYHVQGFHISFRTTQCLLDGQVVGLRSYDSDGILQKETPLRNGKKHGREYVWDETGALESVESYVDGKLHGVARQYNRKGKVIGTYRFVHGTGYDIWRYEKENGTIGISEIFSLKDGNLDGFEWWLRSDQHSVWHERHWRKGTPHGVERMWNAKGRLKRGYPKYWIGGQAVDKRTYIRASEQDKSLPPYQEADNRPRRRFPPAIETLLS